MNHKKQDENKRSAQFLVNFPVLDNLVENRDPSVKYNGLHQRQNN